MIRCVFTVLLSGLRSYVFIIDIKFYLQLRTIAGTVQYNMSHNIIANNFNLTVKNYSLYYDY